MPLPLSSLPLRKASILIVSLWAFAVLSILSLALAGFLFQQIKFSNYFLRQAMSLPMARAACLRAFKDRAKDPTPEYDSFEEVGRENSQPLCDSAAYKYSLAERKMAEGEERIIDEGSLINVNLASLDVLGRLPGLDEELAKNIKNSTRLPFRRKEEILLVEGMTKEIYGKIKDLVTVYGSGKININTASKEVLHALGLDEELIGIIARYRQEFIGEDGVEGSGDDGAFTGQSSILSSLANFSGLSLRQEQDLLSLMNLLDVRSEYLRLNVIPQVKGKDGLRYSIVIHPAENKIISWLEY